jgi:predicted MPP superfamily phosphohydrolase
VQRRKQAFLERLARLDADVVVGTGDFIGDRRSCAATVRALEAIPARRARLFVLGSNDYYAPRLKNPFAYLLPAGTRGEPRHGVPNPWREMVAGLEASGWRLMNNTSTTIEANGVAPIEVVGLDDPHIGRDDLSVARARDGQGFRLGVVHSPDAAPPLAALGYDLILCGHTHGGQIRVPLVGALVTNSLIPRRMARGVHPIDDAWLHVCAGLGTSMYSPIRLFCRPEACLLELVPRESYVLDKARS